MLHYEIVMCILTRKCEKIIVGESSDHWLRSPEMFSIQTAGVIGQSVTTMVGGSPTVTTTGAPYGQQVK